jgi:hypothetical protein
LAERAARRAAACSASADDPKNRMAGLSRVQLLAALADVGVEPDDYALIEQAKDLVDEVNRRLRARRSEMVYSVTFCAAGPLRPSAGEIS